MAMDFTRIRQEEISGLDSSEMNFLEYLFSSDDDRIFDQFTGLSDENMKELNNGNHDAGLYPDLSEEINSVIEDLERESKNENTTNQTNLFVAKFKHFLKEKKLPQNIETMPTRYLCHYLRYWYASARKVDGGIFSPSTYICMRASIQRYLSSSEVNRQNNIITDPEFNAANRTLQAAIGKYLQTNQNPKQQSKAIDKLDLQILGKYFDRSTPKVLQEEVFYLIIFHFGFRGREWVRNLTKESIIVHTDIHGREYIELLKPLSEKNVKPSTSRRHYESGKEIFMFSTPENKDKCPVQAVKKYLEKISNVTVLFPKPLKLKKNCAVDSQPWYSDCQVLGKNKLNDLMKIISENAGLSQIYTNHCIRATVVTEMAEKGYQMEDIMGVTGHKRTDSVQRYIKRITPTKKMKISNDLSESLQYMDLRVLLSHFLWKLEMR